MRLLCRRLLLATASWAVILWAGNGNEAQAIPELQIYIEGATYDATEDQETWVFDDLNSTITVWAIGNVGATGAIFNVRMAVAYTHIEGVTPVITLTPTTADGYGGFTDPSTPAGPYLIQTVTDGRLPLLGDGSSSLPDHGVYGEGVDWQEFGLGDFTLTDSPIGDFITALPSPKFSSDETGLAQINAYEVDVTGLPDGELITLHFDLYDHYVAGNTAKAKFKSVFAPFSHDGEETSDVPNDDPPVASLPEPGSLVIWGLGLMAIGLYRRRRS